MPASAVRPALAVRPADDAEPLPARAGRAVPPPDVPAEARRVVAERDGRQAVRGAAQLALEPPRAGPLLAPDAAQLGREPPHDVPSPAELSREPSSSWPDDAR
ncbi:MAG: hypothetical protein JO043_08050 [Candidatus Eremiobacteraeota bacterium]|nr:hypothetical protein [Candidatus Eremiobacteraeota bacterium]